MPNDGTVKIYRNKFRNLEERHEPYVPQYQQLGLEPEHVVAPAAPPGFQVLVSKTPAAVNPRDSRPMVRQEITPPPAPVRNILPNVGNNIGQTWSGVDSGMIDDISEEIDFNHPMIDNNNFVDHGVSVGQVGGSVLSTLQSMDEDAYLLIVQGQEICSGPIEFVQEQTTLLVFGEHEDYMGEPISTDDILVIKKVKLKVGVFLT